MGMKKTGYRRSHKSTIAVVQSALDLTVYLFQVTNNDKNFPKVLRYTLVSDIRNSCLELNKRIAKAIDIKPKHKEEWKYKLKHMRKVKDAFIDIKTLLAVSSSVAKLRKPEFLAELLTKVADDMNTWFNYEKRRNSKLPTKEEYEIQHQKELEWRKVWYSYPRDEEGFMRLQWKQGNLTVYKT